MRDLLRTPWCRSAFQALLLAAVFLVPALYRLGAPGLYEPDEGRYAEIAREMVGTGDWMVPRLNGLVYAEKPPLYYWVTAASFRIFGLSEWAGRLPGVLAGFGTVLLTWWWGRRLHGETAGWLGALLVATSIQVPLLARVMVTDMWVTFFLVASFVVAGLLLEPPSPGAPPSWKICLLFAVALAGGTLTKGLIGIVLPSVPLVLALVLSRRRGDVLAAGWRPILLRAAVSAILFFALAAPWFVLVGLRVPGFTSFFFVHEHLQRFASAEAHHEGPVWYFVAVLLAGLFPWTGLLPAAVLRGSRRPRFWPEVPPHRIYPALAAAHLFLFFSVSGSKLPTYILPVFGPLGVLLGPGLSELVTGAGRPRRADWIARSAGALLLLALGAAFVLASRVPLHEYPLGEGAHLAMRALAALTGGTVLVAVSLWVLRPRVTVALAALVGALVMIPVVDLQTAVSPFLSQRESARAMLREGLGPEDAIVALEGTGSGLSFYTRRLVRILADPGELQFGKERAGAEDPFIPSTAAFRDLIARGPRTWVVMRSNRIARFHARTEGLPVREVYNNGRRAVFVATPPP